MCQHRTSDDGGVAGVILGNVLLDLAYQVSAHIGSLYAIEIVSMLTRE